MNREKLSDVYWDDEIGDYVTQCPDCKGSGAVRCDDDPLDDDDYYCDTCNGNGLVKTKKP